MTGLERIDVIRQRLQSGLHQRNWILLMTAIYTSVMQALKAAQDIIAFTSLHRSLQV